jgi:hypothetical protein
MLNSPSSVLLREARLFSPTFQRSACSLVRAGKGFGTTQKQQQSSGRSVSDGPPDAARGRTRRIRQTVPGRGAPAPPSQPQFDVAMSNLSAAAVEEEQADFTRRLAALKEQGAAAAAVASQQRQQGGYQQGTAAVFDVDDGSSSVGSPGAVVDYSNPPPLTQTLQAALSKDVSSDPKLRDAPVSGCMLQTDCRDTTEQEKKG